MKPLLKTLTMLLYLQLYPDINVLTQQLEACAIHFLPENIKISCPVMETS